MDYPCDKQLLALRCGARYGVGEHIMIRTMLVGLALLTAQAGFAATPAAKPAAASTAAPAAAPAAAPSVAVSQAQPIVDCMRNNIPASVQVKEIELTSRDRGGGERLLRGRLYATNEKERVKAMLKIGAPPDLAGAAYLIREGEKSDEIYIYVPALNKVRRVTGGSMDGPLWGTDLSYNDLKQVQNAFFDPGARLEGKGELDGTPVQILQFTPQPGQTTRYTAIRAWVEPKSCMALKAEFYEGATVRKRFSGAAKDLKQAGTTWYLSDMTVSDLKEGTQTRLRVTGVTAGKDLADRLFNPGTFYVGN